jgi:hypothetical protein
LNVFPPRIVATLDVPGGVSGPPQAVAITPYEGLAFITSSSRPDPAKPGQVVNNDVLTVVDLKATPPVVIATLHTGGQAGGVSINRAGTLALVGTRTDGGVAEPCGRGRVERRQRLVGGADTLSVTDLTGSLPRVRRSPLHTAPPIVGLYRGRTGPCRDTMEALCR